MKDIMGSDARPVLDSLARDHALLVFDFDGTLAPLVARRDEAEIRPGTRALLRAVALLYPCAVVSGRARSDVAGRVREVPLVAVVGNHGAEAGHGPLDKTRRARLLAWKQSLADAIEGEPGIELEDKTFSIAVHYQHAACRATARHLVLTAAAALEGARVFGGKAVVNVIPGDALDKAAAVAEIKSRVGARRVLYAGDDRTDESVFRQPGVDVTVRIGRTARSVAHHYLRRQEDIDELLRALLVARKRIDGRGERWEGLARATRP